MGNTTTRRLLIMSGFALSIGFASLVSFPIAAAATYPPQLPPQAPGSPNILPTHTTSVIFTNTHFYPVGPNPNGVEIKVDVLDNYLGDFTKYQWVYTVTNHTFDPLPGTSNGFSGFELALPLFVPDIANVIAPDGIGPWLINCCSGQPVEWDLSNTNGAGVGGGTMPGQTEVYSFTTFPRLITTSTGWFHSWESDLQAEIITYPAGDGPEVPDLLAPPNEELCCQETSPGIFSCTILPAGQCAALGGQIVIDCNHCPPATPAEPKSWGQLKTIYR